MNEDRISVLYGKNGSGKSTISNTVRKAKGDVVDDIVQATLLDEKDMAFVDTQCIHVFNEDYVSPRVKIRDDGLNFFSDEERRRTAQEVICFVYLLNKRHVLAHLEGKQNIETNIQKWCADIKSFCAGDKMISILRYF